jgi:hypothetical protein
MPVIALTVAVLATGCGAASPQDRILPPARPDRSTGCIALSGTGWQTGAARVSGRDCRQWRSLSRRIDPREAGPIAECGTNSRMRDQ